MQLDVAVSLVLKWTELRTSKSSYFVLFVVSLKYKKYFALCSIITLSCILLPWNWHYKKHIRVKSSFSAESEVYVCDDEHIFVLWWQACWHSAGISRWPTVAADSLGGPLWGLEGTGLWTCNLCCLFTCSWFGSLWLHSCQHPMFYLDLFIFHVVCVCIYKGLWQTGKQGFFFLHVYIKCQFWFQLDETSWICCLNPIHLIASSFYCISITQNYVA